MEKWKVPFKVEDLRLRFFVANAGHSLLRSESACLRS